MTGWHEVLVIARRELLERVRSKWFVAVTLLGPIAMVALVLVPSLFASSGEGARIDIVDRSGVLADPLVAGLAAARFKPTKIDPGTPDATELARIRDRQIAGFLAIPADALDGGKVLYRGDNGSSFTVEATLREQVRVVVQSARGRRAGIPDDKLVALIMPPRFESQQTTGTTEASSGLARFWLGYTLAYVLLLVIMLYAISVMRSIVQEKTTRVMELMVATVKPRSLMTGKIAGVGIAGLIQIAVWLAMGALTLAYRDQILGAFGVSTSGNPALPALTPGEIAVALAFFVVGYFFYAAMYAAVGAMVSSEQDTQQVQMPITLSLLVAMACVPLVSDDPRGTAATIVTMVPLWSALLMPMRYLLGGATLGEAAVSLVILVASTVLVTRAAAKIYRVGVLMYGKRPGLAELIRWLRY